MNLNSFIADQIAQNVASMTPHQIVQFMERYVFAVIPTAQWSVLYPLVKGAIEAEQERRQPVAPFVLRLSDFSGH